MKRLMTALLFLIVFSGSSFGVNVEIDKIFVDVLNKTDSDLGLVMYHQQLNGEWVISGWGRARVGYIGTIVGNTKNAKYAIGVVRLSDKASLKVPNSKQQLSYFTEEPQFSRDFLIKASEAQGHPLEVIFCERTAKQTSSRIFEDSFTIDKNAEKISIKPKK